MMPATGGWLHRALALVALALAFATPARAAPGDGERKLALVVGVADYGAASLTNPVRDAEAVAASLGKLGFEVTPLKNPTRGELRAAVDALYRTANEGSRNTTVVFYYGGHGVQIGGQNYLIPSKTDLLNGASSLADFEDEAIRAQWVQAKLSEAKISRLLMILDACRNNPLAVKAGATSAGLAKMSEIENGPDTMIVFSAQPGKTADDGPAGKQSYFARALADTLLVPDYSLVQVFDAVGASVASQTRGAQKPYLEGSLHYVLLPKPAQRTGPMGGSTGAAQFNSPEDGAVLLDAALKSRPLSALIDDANAGDGWAAYLVGMAFWDGKGGVAKSTPQARQYMRLAISKGVGKAASALGYFACCEPGVAANEEDALGWFEIGSQMGTPGAKRNLASMYRDGRGTGRDITKAETLYQEAANAGLPAAWQEWGNIYSTDRYGKFDPTKAETLYRHAIDEGYAVAALALGNAYQFGFGPARLKRDPSRALAVYIAGGEQGCAACWSSAAKMHAGDELGPPDPAAAYSLYRRAADLDDPDGLLEAGRALQAGKGIAQDGAAAAVDYRRAIAVGNREAVGALGRMLAKGVVVKRQPAEAARLLRDVLKDDVSPDPAIRHAVYAPNYWGFGQTLAELIEGGVVPALNGEEAPALRRRYGQSDGGLKRFTISIDCGGQETPFDIYLIDWDRPGDETPAESQVAWLKEMRGCEAKPANVEWFKQVKTEAREKNTSFITLAAAKMEAKEKASQSPAAP